MKYVDYVNVKQGTASERRFSHGNTLPLTALPHALAMFAPQTSSERGSWFYHPNDKGMEGIRLTHQASPWVRDWAFLCFMPQDEKLVANTFLRWSSFDAQQTILQPHFLQLHLLRYKTKLSLTPTESGAMILVQVDESVKTPVFSVLPSDFCMEICVKEKERRIEGFTCSYSFAPYRDDFKTYFVFQFDCDIYGEMRESVGEKAEAVGVKTANKTYAVRFATSFISLEQAKRNLQRELQGKSFDEIKTQAENAWENLLSRVKIEADEDVKKTFYSCMYRAFLYPNKFYEIDDNGHAVHIEPEAGTIKRGVSYTNNGFWDTYRTVYPFYSLVAPEKVNEILEGFLNVYDDVGALPRWLTPSEFNCMPGTLIEAVFADAIVKNLLSPENARRALCAMVENSKRQSQGRRIARKCVDEYVRLGYIPFDKCEESVNETLDSAYGDFCISVVAEKLGETETAKAYRESSQKYKNLFDAHYGCMRGKDSNGNFRQEEFDAFAWGRDYTEGSSWQASFAVPHDYVGLAELYGGKEAFLRKIDDLFSAEPKFSLGGYPLEIHEMTEMAASNFGQCAISNQPSFHIPFLYAEFGEKEKSHAIVQRMASEVFSYREDGFPGDEDNGSMACWYLFAALGFYPMCPAKAEFTVSGALVQKATLCINGKEIDLVKKLQGKEKINYFDLIG